MEGREGGEGRVRVERGKKEMVGWEVIGCDLTAFFFYKFDYCKYMKLLATIN